MSKLDIVIYGATGFTGQQAVKYFQNNAPSNVQWGIAGRDPAKLEQLRADVPIAVANHADQSSLDAMVRGARIIVSTAGPFELYSDGVVDACVRLGSHYLDISGETMWNRSLIERFHDRANSAGIRILPSCGFDSVPSDLAAIWLNEHIGGAVEIKAYFDLKGGQPNGGTAATGFHVASAVAKDRLQDPFLLVTEKHREPKPVEIDPVGVRYDSNLRTWVTPFIMGPINSRVVRRSCSLLGLDFSYQEYAKCTGFIQAHFASAIGNIIKFSIESPRLRKKLQTMSPRPGTGPTDKTMDEGWFRCELLARNVNGQTSRAHVSGQGDPANRVTVKCVCESAFALACEEEFLPKRAGVLTPSTGIGQALQDRLITKGISFVTTNC